MKKKFLIIEDDDQWLLIFKKKLPNEDIAFAKCTTVEDAFQAITMYGPEIIFLDHNLTTNGDEGLYIADHVNGVKIYSTTADFTLATDYRKRGIEIVGKDLEKIMMIISQS
jgi:ActR/RegA family two-component response regulator